MSADWILNVCLFKESNILQLPRQLSIRLSVVSSCQAFLAMFGVFPKGPGTWYLSFNLIFDLWCLPEPTGSWLCSFSFVHKKCSVISPDLFSSRVSACRNESFNWRALLGLPRKTTLFKRDNYTRSISELKSVYENECVRGNAIHSEFTKSLIMKYSQNVGNRFWVTLLTQ